MPGCALNDVSAGPFRVNTYQLDEQIGEGTHALCFRALNTSCKTKYCLKLSKSLRARDVFLNEVEIMSRLANPHLAELFECFEFQGRQVRLMAAVP